MPHTVIASGNLATPLRTIFGTLSQCRLLGVDQAVALETFTSAGLPPRALEELEFPISLSQELEILHALVKRFVRPASPVKQLFASLPLLGIETLGVLGMAMRHAPNAIDALSICLTYPQLTGGHSRLIVREQGQELVFVFHMERPQLRQATGQETEDLVRYCTVLDLVSSMRNTQGVVEQGITPLYIDFSFPEPADWNNADPLPCPVRFGRPETMLAYPAELRSLPTPHANPLLYQSYVSIAERMSQMLAVELSFSEQVSRWLWAYSPPPGRAEIAGLLHMSERSLTRKLAEEGSSYAAMLAAVQSERARNLLHNKALSVAEVGYRIGYADPAAFSRAFSQWTGLPPGKWRKALT